MLFFILLFLAIMVWPRFILYFMVAPFLGAILGGFVWAMAMFASGCTLPLSSIGVFVMGGMALSLFYTIFWANKNNI